jgi:hypothetical protein
MSARIYLYDLILYEGGPLSLCQFLDVKTDFPWAIDPGKHSRAHARVVMIRGGANQHDLMAAFPET